MIQIAPPRPRLGMLPTACLILSAAVLGAASPAGALRGDPPGPSSSAPPAILEPATVPLDARIDGSKVTTVGDPSLPRFVAPPLPAVLRIAEKDAEIAMSPESVAAARAALDRGLDYLIASQGADGSWMRGSAVTPTDQSPREGAASVAVSALAVKAIAQAPTSPTRRDALDRALRFVTASLAAGGGFDGLAAGGIGNYVASAVVMGLATAGRTEHADRLAEGVMWLQEQQWDQREGVAPAQDWFGGAGYGRHGRPDLSNTQLMLDALHDAGVSTEDPAVQRALVFVSRTQNLKATNPASWAQAGSDDGGFVYTPANGGESFASEAAGEGRYGEIQPEGVPRSLRSYGSMTYAGFKSLLYAGLTADDPRVRAAFDWIRRHWTFDENPGLGQQGHYYYLHAMARALLAAQQAEIETADGVKRNWRDELVAALASRQRDDGSWINEADRWEEGRPELVTVYALLALEEALKPAMTLGD